jgi:RNA polymerase sigma-70 factor (ECF subfamily)
MNQSPSDETSPTLLARLGQGASDQVAWETFVARYGPKIRGWCLQRSLQAADAEDVTQEVLLRLARALQTFTYDPSRSFRGWLHLMTRHALSEFFADRKRRPDSATCNFRGLTALEAAQATDDLLTLLNEEFTGALVSKACDTVRARVEKQTWEAFRLTACENISGENVAALLGMSVTAVFKAKSRVLGFIRQEVKRLDDQP